MIATSSCARFGVFSLVCFLPWVCACSDADGTEKEIEETPNYRCSTMGLPSGQEPETLETADELCPALPRAFGEISVMDATYGGNCDQPHGNVTWAVAPACAGYGSCRYQIVKGDLGVDSACDKAFRVRYTCSNQSERVRMEFAPEEADGRVVLLTCPE